MKYIEEFNTLSVLLRLILSVIFGAIIGMQRPFRRHDAGLRTFALVCLGSSLATIVNIYLLQTTGSADTSRIPAGVISGIGFIGVGSIIITSRREIRGLTTAAGLWVTAAIGIALGSGMIYISCFTFILSITTVRLLLIISSHAERNDRMIEMYIELEDKAALDSIRKYMLQNSFEIRSMEKHRDKAANENGLTLLMETDMKKRHEHIQIIKDLENIDGISYVEEIKA